MADVALKKIEKPLVCFLRLYGTAKRRMLNVRKKYSTTHNDVAMAGTLTEILRLEMQADEFDPNVARAATEARKLGIDPVGAIRNAIAERERDQALSPAVS